eukprot:2874209-Prymnesium_polylepis.1
MVLPGALVGALPRMTSPPHLPCRPSTASSVATESVETRESTLVCWSRLVSVMGCAAVPSAWILPPRSTMIAGALPGWWLAIATTVTPAEIVEQPAGADKELAAEDVLGAGLEVQVLVQGAARQQGDKRSLHQEREARD